MKKGLRPYWNTMIIGVYFMGLVGLAGGFPFAGLWLSS